MSNVNTSIDMMNVAIATQTLIAIVIIAILVMAIAAFIMAIWDFIRSQWEEENKKRGRNRIRFMMIGIVLVIIFLILLPLLLRRLGVVNYELFTAPSIFWRIGEVLNYTFSIWWIIKDFTLEEWWFGSPLQTRPVTRYTL